MNEKKSILIEIDSDNVAIDLKAHNVRPFEVIGILEAVRTKMLSDIKNLGNASIAIFDEDDAVPGPSGPITWVEEENPPDPAMPDVREESPGIPVESEPVKYAHAEPEPEAGPIPASLGPTLNDDGYDS